MERSSSYLSEIKQKYGNWKKLIRSENHDKELRKKKRLNDGEILTVQADIMEGEDGRPAGGSCAMQGHVQDSMWGLNTMLLDRRCIRNFIILKQNVFCFPNMVQLLTTKTLISKTVQLLRRKQNIQRNQFSNKEHYLSVWPLCFLILSRYNLI